MTQTPTTYPSGPAPAAPPITATQASTEAQQTGAPVVVTSETTQTSQVTANPDGTYTLSSSAQPVRVQKSGGWIPIDTTLHANTDGTLSPSATTAGVAFSGGGTGPAITMSAAQGTVSLSWPTALPPPAVSGSSALYASVLPGVDLQLTATGTGFSQVLIVHTASAASNPALTSLHFGVISTGLNTSVAASGQVIAADSSGQSVFASGSPIMWDSTNDPQIGPTPTATDAGSGHVTPLTMTTGMKQALSASSTSTTLTLNVPSAALTGSNVTYPLYIDPPFENTSNFYVEVTDSGWNYYNQSNEDMQIGTCVYSNCGGTWTGRAFFHIDTSALSSRNGVTAQIFSADMRVDQDHNGSCAASPVDLVRSSTISTSTVWPGPSGVSELQQLSTANGNNSEGGCSGNPVPAGYIDFNNTNVVGQVQLAANTNAAYTTFGLIADAESPGGLSDIKSQSWKRFVSMTAGAQPTLDVTFNYAPATPSGLKVANAVYCGGHYYTSDINPTLIATTSSNNPPPNATPLDEAFVVSNSPGFGSPGILASGQTLASGYQLSTSDGDVSLFMLSSGDLYLAVQYDMVWHTNTSSSGAHVIMQSDGNLVVYSSGGTALWSSGTSGHSGAYAKVQANGDFGVYSSTGSLLWHTNTTSNPGPTRDSSSEVATASNGTASWTTSAFGHPSPIGNGDWAFQVRADSDPGQFDEVSSGWSSWLPFTDLQIGPQYAPTIWSADYPSATAWGSPANTTSPFTPAAPGTFLIGNGGSKGVVGYTYQWDGGGENSERMPTNTDCNYNQTFTGGGWIAPASDGTATITVPGSLTPGYHTLNVRAFDAAHNASPDSGTLQSGTTYGFYVAPTVKASEPATRSEAEALVTSGALVALGTAPAPATSSYVSSPPLWSGNTEAYMPATAVGQQYQVTFSAASGEGDYALGVNMTKYQYDGRVTFTLDQGSTTNPPFVLGNTDTHPFDGYLAGGLTSTSYVSFGSVHLTTGTHTITMKVAGTTSGAYWIGVDYLSVIPLNLTTDGSFQSAANNHGITSDGSAGANFALDQTGGYALSAQSLAAAGYAPGAHVTVAGASFTMPTASTLAANAGDDNIIADGQSVNVSGNDTAVALLAISVNGASPSGQTARITYTDGTYENPVMPSVPDWLSGPNAAATVNLGHLDNASGTPVMTLVPEVYAIFLPANPTKTVQSVTLPYFADSTTPGNYPQTLRILAVGAQAAASGWLGAWAAAPDSSASPPGSVGLANQTLRLVVHPPATGTSGMTGTNVRVRLSNTYVPTSTTIDDATIAAQSGSGAATNGTPTQLTFCLAAGLAIGCGQHSVALPGGGDAYSDPVATPTTPSGGNGNLVVSLHLPNAVLAAPTHQAANTMNYLASGDATNDATGSPYTTTLTSWLYLTGVDISTTNSGLGTVAVIGDAVPGSALPLGSTTYQPTWIDDLPAQLAAAGDTLPGTVVNASPRGNESIGTWTSGNSGSLLNELFLAEPNLRSVILELGYNDIMTLSSTASTTAINNMLAAIEANIRLMMSGYNLDQYGARTFHRNDGQDSNIALFLTTIPPLNLAPSDSREILREDLNNDIRNQYANWALTTSLIDFDAATRSASAPYQLDPSLTGNVPGGAVTSAYYTKVANTFATTFPPPQL